MRMFHVRAHQTRIARPNGNEDRGEVRTANHSGDRFLKRLTLKLSQTQCYTGIEPWKPPALGS